MDNKIYLHTSDFIRHDDIGLNVNQGPFLNIYSKITYQGVEYSFEGTRAFALCRGTQCDGKTYLGVSSHRVADITNVAAEDKFNQAAYLHNTSNDTWGITSYSPPSPEAFALSPANADLQAALGSDTVFEMEWID